MDVELWMACPSNNMHKLIVPAVLLASALLFLSFSILGLNGLGLSYDECVFVNAALGGVTNDFIYMRVFDIPFMTFIYEGGLKAWLYYPIFKIFGISMLSIRLPAIMLAMAAIFIWYKNAQYIFSGLIYPLAFVLILATDASYIHHTNVEYNTIALQSLLTALTFYFYLRFVNNQSIRSLGLFFILIILGVFNRFNFIWLAVSLATTAFVFDRKSILQAYKKNLRASVLCSAAFLLTMSVMAYFLLLPAAAYPIGGNIVDTLSIDRVKFIGVLYWDTMTGNLPYHKYFTKDLPFSALETVKNFLITFTILATSLLLILVKIFRYQNQSWWPLGKKQLYCFTLTAIMLGLIIITPPARTSYHMLILWPLPQLTFLLSIAVLSNFTNLTKTNFIIMFITTGMVAIQIITNTQYYTAKSNPTTQVDVNWAPEIYQLADYVNGHAKDYDAILALNFGINNQLIALARDNNIRKKLHEETWYLLPNQPEVTIPRNMLYPLFDRDNATNEKWLFEKIYRNKTALLIRVPAMEFSTDSVDFAAFVAKYHLTINFLFTISDINNYPVYFLYTSSHHDNQIKNTD